MRTPWTSIHGEFRQDGAYHINLLQCRPQTRWQENALKSPP